METLTALLLCILCGCTSPARPSETEIYPLVLSAIRNELDLPTLAIHPLLAFVQRTPPGDTSETAYFNASDTTTVQNIVTAAPPGLYTLCEPRLGGSCPPIAGKASVVLSELLDLGANGIGVYLLVTDERRNRSAPTEYLARLKRGPRGWAVVELRRLAGGG